MLHDTKSHESILNHMLESCHMSESKVSVCHDCNLRFSSCFKKRLVPAFCLFSPPGRVADGLGVGWKRRLRSFLKRKRSLSLIFLEEFVKCQYLRYLYMEVQFTISILVPENN